MIVELCENSYHVSSLGKCRVPMVNEAYKVFCAEWLFITSETQIEANYTRFVINSNSLSE